MKKRPIFYTDKDGNLLKNSLGKPREVLLNEMEQRLANFLQRQVNALGYEVAITTLTTIVKKVTTQKFFETPPADYMPVRVGEGAWSSNLETFRTFDSGADFETGILNTGVDNARLAMADAGVDSLNIKVFDWAKAITWTIIDLQKASKSGNWDLVTSKERARKRNWDLGIQKIAFLGKKNDSRCLGLLTQSSSSVNTNTTVITKAIKTMTPAELKAFQEALIETYRENCARSAWPTHFIIPESDYNGLASQASPDFPVKSTLELLTEGLKIATRNPNFKVLPLAYGDAAYNAGFLNGTTGQQQYVLLNYDEESIRMDIPVDYTNTLANSFNNFSFQNVGYGEFTGVLAYRPLETLYFKY